MVIPSAWEENIAAAQGVCGQHVLTAPTAQRCRCFSGGSGDAGEMETKGVGTVFHTDLVFL